MPTTSSNFSRLQELLPELFQANQLTGDSYLRCQLTPEISVLISMEFVQESLLVAEEQITAIPNMSPYVVGLMSSRNHVFCLIDLPQLLGLTTNIFNSRRVYHTIVTRVSESSNSQQELLFGFVFHRVQGVTRLMSNQLKPPQDDLPENLTPYIKGCVIQQAQEIPLLDFRAIINNSNLLETSSI